MSKRCRFGGETKANGNCSVAGDDGLPVQCVGPWAEEKHDYLRRYLAASGGPRQGFIPPVGPGGAAFVDLFAGPGRARIGATGALVDGSPLIAFKQEVPFTKIILCDVDGENAAALMRRVHPYGTRAVVRHGDCNREIEAIVGEIPTHGLNVALVDPFRLADLQFATLARLAAFKKMDLILFFPVGELRRFLDRSSGKREQLDRALGTDEWRAILRSGRDAAKLIPFIHDRLERECGYKAENSYSAPIRNRRNVVMYHLVFLSKHARGAAIWESVTKRAPSGQRRLF